MFDRLIEIQILLGIVFWLGLHQLAGYGWRLCQRQSWLQGRRQKAKYSTLPGLLEKPHCAHCAAASESSAAVVPEAPPMMRSSRGGPRQVNTGGHYCPNAGCGYYGWLSRGNIRANGRPNGRKWRQFPCRFCGHYFLKTHGTLFYGKHHPSGTIL